MIKRLISFSASWPVALIGFGCISIILRRDVGWDIKNYHLYNAYAFLHHRLNLDIQPAQMQSYFNPLLDVATFKLIEWFPPRIFGFILGAIHGLNFWLIYRIALRIFNLLHDRTNEILAFACAVVSAIEAIALSEVGSGVHDLTVAITTNLSVLLMLIAFERKSVSPKSAALGYFVSGIVLGLGIGFKYTCAIYAIGLGVAFIFCSESIFAYFTQAIVWGLGVGVGFLSISGYWMSVLWAKFRNPLFPYFNHVFKSPYALPDPYTDPRFFPKNIWQTLFYPYYFNSSQQNTMEWPFQDFRLAVVHFLLLLTVVVLIWRRISSRSPALIEKPRATAQVRIAPWFITFFVVSYVVWEAKFSIYRYTAALEQMAPIAIVVLLGVLISRTQVRMGAAFACFALIIATVRRPYTERFPWGSLHSRFVEASIPSFPSPEKSVVVMTSTEPIGYLVQFLPPAVSVIRVESNFFNPAMNTRLAQEIRDRLSESDKNFYLLTPASAIGNVDSVLAPYRLSMVTDTLAKVTNNVGDEIRFAELHRTAN